MIGKLVITLTDRTTLTYVNEMDDRIKAHVKNRRMIDIAIKGKRYNIPATAIVRWTVDLCRDLKFTRGWTILTREDQEEAYRIECRDFACALVGMMEASR